MSEKSAALAQQLEQVSNEVIQTVESLSSAHWQARGAEGWTVAATTRHVAGGLSALAGMVSAVANGQPLPPITQAGLDEGNAKAAIANEQCSKEDCLKELRENGRSAVEIVKGLSDEQLARTGTLMGNTFTAEQLTARLLIGHAQGHLQNIKAVI